MVGLIFDTSSENALIGHIVDGTLENQCQIPLLKNLSTTFFPALEPYIENISYIAVGVGPGSYIGVRAAATIAKTLAFAKNLPLVEFSSILLYLPKHLDQNFAFIGDAKMGQHFLITGEVQNKRIQNLSEPKIGSLEEFLAANQNYLIGPDLPPPHLQWAVAVAYDQFLQGKILDSKDLSLTYLR